VNHDALFKMLLKRPAILKGFFKAFLPPVARFIDFARELITIASHSHELNEFRPRKKATENTEKKQATNSTNRGKIKGSWNSWRLYFL